MKKTLCILSTVLLASACGGTTDTLPTEKITAKIVKTAQTFANTTASTTADKAAAVAQANKDEIARAAKALTTGAHPDRKSDLFSAAQLKEGVHFEALPQPVRTITPGKIEITEVFAYSCGHCYKFESYIQPWKSTLPDYIEVVHSPVVWRNLMEPHARIVYTGKALGIFDQVHARTFKAIHEENNRLSNEKAIAKMFAEFGVDEEKFKKTYNSFGVDSQVKQAISRAKGMRISGTPEVVVDGRFRISTGMPGVQSQPNMLKVAHSIAALVKQNKM